MEKSHVSLEQKQCHICGTLYNTDSILLNTRLRPTLSRYTITGLGTCPSCQSFTDQGYIHLVVVFNPPSASPTLQPSEAIHTGLIIRIRRSIFPEIFSTPLPTGTDMIFIDQATAEELQSLVHDKEVSNG